MTHANRLAVLTQIKIRAAIIAEIFRKSARMSIECARPPAARPAPPSHRHDAHARPTLWPLHMP